MFEFPHRLHPAAIIIKLGAYFAHTFRAFLPILAIEVFRLNGPRAHRSEIFILITFAVVGAISLVGPILHYFTTTFVIRDGSFEISTGLIWRKRRTIPLARIQNVNIERTMWHRLLKAAAVKVETATGASGEGSLAAVSMADAANLQHVLLRDHQQSGPPAAEAAPVSVLRLSLKQVMIAGALKNRALFIVASVLGALQFDRSNVFFRPAIRFLRRLDPGAAFFAGAAILVGLIIIGWLVSVVLSATRYYNFRVDRHEKGLLITRGLITQVRDIVPVGRIQDIRISEPLFFRLFGYAEMLADTAGTFRKEDIGSASTICPLLPVGSVESLGRLLIPMFDFESLRWRSLNPAIIGFRVLHAVIFASVVFGGLTALEFANPAIHLRGPLMYGLLIGYVAFAILSAALYFRVTGFAYSHDLLASRHGVLARQATVIPFDRIQHYSVRSSWLQRQFGLATVSARSAAAGGHSILVPCVEASVAEELRRNIGASIQEHLGDRRGGI